MVIQLHGEFLNLYLRQSPLDLTSECHATGIWYFAKRTKYTGSISRLIHQIHDGMNDYIARHFL